MIRGFYSAASGLVSQQAHLNVIANNVANVNTTGFKPQQAGFTSLLYKNINGGAGNQISCGHGAKLDKTGIDFIQGDLKPTNMKYDFALLGPGFFAVEGKNGKVTYTRDGSFDISVEGKRSYLVNRAGAYVLDSRERKIEINESFDSAQIGVFNFTNIYGLELLGGNQFAATECSGKVELVNKPNIKVGFLENSSTQVSKEMVKMIEATKSFSFSSRIVQAADEMEKTVNQLR